MHIHFVLLKAPRTTLNRILTTNLHLMSLRCSELRTNCLSLPKGVTAAISVEKSDLWSF